MIVPISAAVKVAAVEAISVTPTVNAALLADCHLITFPVYPVMVMAFGVVPLQIVVTVVSSVPGTVAGFTVTILVSDGVVCPQKLLILLTQYVVVTVGFTVSVAVVSSAMILEPIVPVPHWNSAFVPAVPPEAVNVVDEPIQMLFAPVRLVGAEEEADMFVNANIAEAFPPFSLILISIVEVLPRLKVPTAPGQAPPPLYEPQLQTKVPLTYTSAASSQFCMVSVYVPQAKLRRLATKVKLSTGNVQPCQVEADEGEAKTFQLVVESNPTVACV